MINIYFCASISGGRADAPVYREMIGYLKTYGRVLTEHIGQLDVLGEKDMADQEIHDRDVDWMRSADVVIAEVTQPSLGVGYELRLAVELEKPVLCLYHPRDGRRLSGMIAGAPGIQTVRYHELSEALKQIEKFLKIHNP